MLPPGDGRRGRCETDHASYAGLRAARSVEEIGDVEGWRFTDPSALERANGAELPRAAGRMQSDGADEAGDRVSIGVDDEVLALCNGAYAEAERRGHGSVEIAHLVVGLTASRLADRTFDGEGLSRRELMLAAEHALRIAGRAVAGQRLRTSAEMRVLLARAEAVARADTREFAALSDLVRALAHRSRDLVSARFVPDARTGAAGGAAYREAEGRGTNGSPAREWHAPRQERFEFDGRQAGHSIRAEREQDARPHFDNSDRRPDAVRERHDAFGAAAFAGRAENHAPALIARIEQQEKLLSNLLDLVSRLMSSPGAGGRALAAGVSEAAGFGGAGEDESSEARQGSGRGHTRSRRRARLGWRRRIVLIGGSGRAQSRRISDASDGAGLRDGVLRLVTRSDTVGTPRRGRGSREIASELDDLAPLEVDAEEEGDGQGDRMKRFYLSPDDDIVRAPSIGPKTAARLIPIGLVLVRDLLSCDPEDIARRTANRYITAGRIAEWKAQARLVCTIPWLRGTHAQLLVGAGYDTLAKLSRADASSVCAAILRFVATREGQSILRSSPPPEIDRIACWIENTALAEPARAA